MKADHSDYLIKAFQAQEKRKHRLFLGVCVFVIADAVMFLMLLVWALLLVAIKPQAWHLFLAPALAACRTGPKEYRDSKLLNVPCSGEAGKYPEPLTGTFIGPGYDPYADPGSNLGAMGS